jgi:hypothetical protein
MRINNEIIATNSTLYKHYPNKKSLSAYAERLQR